MGCSDLIPYCSLWIRNSSKKSFKKIPYFAYIDKKTKNHIVETQKNLVETQKIP